MREKPFNDSTIFRMGSLYYKFNSGLDCSVVIENAEGFVRPINFYGSSAPAETSRMTKPLRLGEVCLTPLQFLSQQFLLGDIQCSPDKQRRFSVFKSRIANAVHDSNTAFRMNNPVFKVAANAFTDHCLGGFID